MLKNVSLSVPSNDNGQESPTTSNSNDKEEESPEALKSDYEKVNSPRAKASSTVPEAESPMSPDTDDMKWSHQQPEDQKQRNDSEIKIKTKDSKCY